MKLISFLKLQRWDPKKSPPKQDFNRKVAEADAYLQLLIDQIKLIEDKQKDLKEDEEDKKQKYGEILTQANAVLNSVKHTIVQLQIAKVCKPKSIILMSSFKFLQINEIWCHLSEYCHTRQWYISRSH